MHFPHDSLFQSPVCTVIYLEGAVFKVMAAVSQTYTERGHHSPFIIQESQLCNYVVATSSHESAASLSRRVHPRWLCRFLPVRRPAPASSFPRYPSPGVLMLKMWTRHPSGLILVVDRLYCPVKLTAFLSWQVTQQLWLQGELVLKEETPSPMPRACGPSEIGSYLQVLGGHQGQQ